MPFANNIIPADRTDAGIQAVLDTNLWPSPNITGTGAFKLARNYFSTGTSGQNRNQVDSKLNWIPNNKLSVFARFGINDSSWFNPHQCGALGGPGFSPSNSAVGLGGGFIYSGTLSATYIFSPTLIVDAYYGYSRNDPFTAQQRLNENLGSTLLKIPGLQSSQVREGGWPALIIDGFGSAGAGQIPGSTIGPYNNFQPQDFQNYEKEWVGNVTWIKATHNLRAGVEYNQQRDNENQEQATFCGFCLGSGGFQFSQGTTQLNGGPAGNDFNAFAAFLLGLPSNAGKVSLFPNAYKYRSEEHTSELQSHLNLVCRLLLEKKKQHTIHLRPLLTHRGPSVHRPAHAPDQSTQQRGRPRLHVQPHSATHVRRINYR